MLLKFSKIGSPVCSFCNSEDDSPCEPTAFFSVQLS